MYEHRRSPLLPVRLYYIRLARHAALAGLVVLVSLGAGMAGYAYFERLALVDAFFISSLPLGRLGAGARLLRLRRDPRLGRARHLPIPCARRNSPQRDFFRRGGELRAADSSRRLAAA